MRSQVWTSPDGQPVVRDQAAGVLGEQLAVGARLVEEALHAGPAGEPEQVVHALGGLGEQRHVGVGAGPADVVVAAVVPADPLLLEAGGVGREVGLHADDRLDPVAAAPWRRSRRRRTRCRGRSSRCASMPSSAVRANRSSSRAAPSSMEYSVWTWRWAKESPEDPAIGGGATPLNESGLGSDGHAAAGQPAGRRRAAWVVLGEGSEAYVSRRGDRVRTHRQLGAAGTPLTRPRTRGVCWRVRRSPPSRRGGPHVRQGGALRDPVRRRRPGPRVLRRRPSAGS